MNLDSILQLSNPDELFDVGERPDYQEFLTKIISYFREEPKYVSGKSDDNKNGQT